MGRKELSSASIFLPSLRVGGAERVTLNLAEGLSRRGIHVDLVLSSAEGKYISEVPTGVRVLGLGNRSVLRSLPRLARYLERENPAILLSAMSHANVAALWARRFSDTDTRVFVTVHAPLSIASRQLASPFEPLIPLLVRSSYPYACGVVAVSHGIAQDLLSAAHLNPASIRVIYNPVVTSKMLKMSCERVDHPWFQPNQPPVAIAVARLAPQKDLSTLLRAISLVRKRRPVRLMIIGEGPDRAKLETLARNLGIQDGVSLPGFVSNPYPYIANSAVFVLSSAWEGLPTSIVEALACGTPVVSTDCPTGPSEILEWGKYGRLVPVGDEKSLAQAIIAQLDETPERERLRLRAADFSQDTITNQYIQMFTTSSGQ